MAVETPTSFTLYELTEEESLQGAIFTILQKQVIQNQRAACAEEKIRLEFDPANPSVFIQQEASLKGQLVILDFLLESSDAAELVILEQAEDLKLMEEITV